MKKLLLVFTLLFNPLNISAETNVCKTDVYFANGILTEEEDAEYNTLEVLNPAIMEMLGTDKFTKKIGEVSYSYNHTIGFFSDGIETFLQKFGWLDWRDLLGDVHGKDVDRHVKAYQASINNRHKVLVVAHSQGNLFTYEAYNRLNSEIQKDFEAVSIASPMSADIKDGTIRVDWDNDKVPRIATFGAGLPEMIKTDVRKVKWESNNIFGSGKPNSNYVTRSDINQTYTKGGYPYTAKENGLNSYVHAFTFYMGDVLRDGNKKAVLNPFTDTTLIDTSAKTKIMNAISTKLNLLCNYEEKCKNKKNNTSPESGIIGVTLSWGNTDLNMSLNSAIGTKDISKSECTSLEHYYVKTEDDVSPGKYAVSVKHSGSIDNNLSSEKINLSIHTPGAAMVFDFDITSADMLDIGHVANIVIEEDKKIKPTRYYGSGSGSGSGSGRYVASKCYGECTNPTGTLQEYIYSIESKLKQATLGPLSNAIVSLTEGFDFENQELLYESSTSGGKSILTSGLFHFTQDVKNSVEDGKYYVMGIHGGDDIDTNDDGIVDNTPTKNLGSIHAIVDADYIKNKNFKANILTELVYQFSKSMISAEQNTTLVKQHLDKVSTRLLSQDINGDEVIDYDDVLAWRPMFDKDKLLKDYNLNYEEVVQKIYKNENIYDEAYSIIYDPILNEQFLTIAEDISSGAVIGKIEVDLYDDNVTFELDSEDYNNFMITNDGTIMLSDTGDLLDYESLTEYNIEVSIKFGDKVVTNNLTITVDNTIDAPTIYDTSLSVAEHSLNDIEIGKIEISSHQDCSIVGGYILGSSSKDFMIDNNQIVRVSPERVIDYEKKSSYKLNITLESECGMTNTAQLNINLIDLDENAEMGYGVLKGKDAIIYRIEENGSLTKEYTSYSSLEKYGPTANDYRSVFNTHKYELEPDLYYLMEIEDGEELDIDYNGILDWSNKFKFKGKMRAIVKGSWLFDIPTIRLSPISEMLVDAIALQAEGYETDTLESRLSETVKEIVRTDVDNDGKITVFDALQYNALSVYDPYVFLGDIKTVVNRSVEIGSVVGNIQTLGIHEGTTSSLKLVGEGSEYFTLENQNSLRVNDSLIDKANKTFEFSVETRDEYNVTSVGDISVMVTPAMYLLGSYDTDGYVRKIEVTNDNKFLFAASSEAGVVILNIEEPKSSQLVAQFIDELDINDSGVNVTSVALSHDGKTLYVTNESEKSNPLVLGEPKQSHLLVLDVSNPEQYNLLSSIAIETNFSPLVDVIVSADDNYVYVVGDMLEIIDIKNKISPQRVSNFEISKETSLYNTGKIKLSTDEKMISISYLDEFMRSVYIDISNIQTPIWVYDKYENIKRDNGSYLNRVIKNGVIGFGVRIWDTNLDVIDLRRLDMWGDGPIIMEFETPGKKENIAISSDEEYLFLSCGKDGIEIIGFHP